MQKKSSFAIFSLTQKNNFFKLDSVCDRFVSQLKCYLSLICKIQLFSTQKNAEKYFSVVFFLVMKRRLFSQSKMISFKYWKKMTQMHVNVWFRFATIKRFKMSCSELKKYVVYFSFACLSTTVSACKLAVVNTKFAVVSFWSFKFTAKLLMDRWWMKLFVCGLCLFILKIDNHCSSNVFFSITFVKK